MTTDPYFIDFEASSLSLYSYPIEVAWSDGAGTLESYLICPDGIADWTDWNKNAARVHGITRRELSRDGRDPQWVCRRLAEVLTGRTVYSDNPDYDALWLARLFEACRRPCPPLDLCHIDTLLTATYCPRPEERVSGLRDLVRIKQTARARAQGVHRAAWDVQYLVSLWRMVRSRTRASPLACVK